MFEAFTIVCSACSKPLKVKRESLIGKKVRCPGCEHQMVVREPRAASGTKKRSPTGSSRRRPSAAKGGAGPARNKQRSKAAAKRSTSKPWLLPVAGGIVVLVVVGLGIKWFLTSPETSAADTAGNNEAQSTVESASEPAPEDNVGSGAQDAPSIAAAPAGEAAAMASEPPSVSLVANPSVDVPGLLASMLELLEKGDAKTFFMQHAPVREHAMITKAIESGRPFPTFPPQLMHVLKNQIRKMQSLTPEFGADGKSVRFVSSNAGSRSGGQTPELKNPLRSSDTATLPGYGADLPAAIKQAVSHLSQNQVEDFVSRMLPPSMVAIMKAEGRWNSLKVAFAAGTDQRTKMLADLKQLLTVTPQIQGNTATYIIERTVTPFAMGRNRRRVTVKDGNREIRFSLIDGHWRFYDRTAQIADDIDVALSQELKVVPSPELERLGLEKHGTDWRLKALPPKP